MRIDNITEELLNGIIQDYMNDPNAQLEVEDNYTEEAFEDKWPFSELKQKKEEEEQKELKKKAERDNKAAIPQKEPDSTNNEEQEKESEAQRQHDEAMKKYHKE